MSDLEEVFSFQMHAVGLEGFVREYAAIPGRRFRFDFAFVPERVLIEIQGGTWNRGAHGRGAGIQRDYEKGNLAVQHGWRVLSFDGKSVKSGEAVETIRKALEG